MCKNIFYYLKSCVHDSSLTSLLNSSIKFVNNEYEYKPLLSSSSIKTSLTNIIFYSTRYLSLSKKPILNSKQYGNLIQFPKSRRTKLMVATTLESTFPSLLRSI